jgi:hypothetical protein
MERPCNDIIDDKQRFDKLTELAQPATDHSEDPSRPCTGSFMHKPLGFLRICAVRYPGVSGHEPGQIRPRATEKPPSLEIRTAIVRPVPCVVDAEKGRRIG